MSLFTVVWTPSAQDLLTECWLAAADRGAVTKAVAAIDLALSNDPAEKGEHVSEGLRQYVSLPLAVLFSVNEADRIVEVASVKAIFREPPV